MNLIRERGFTHEFTWRKSKIVQTKIVWAFLILSIETITIKGTKAEQILSLKEMEWLNERVKENEHGRMF